VPLTNEDTAKPQVRVGERVGVLSRLRDLHAFLRRGHRLREVPHLGQAPHEMAAREHRGQPVLAEVLIGGLARQQGDDPPQVVHSLAKRRGRGGRLPC
jgi:hypothetical protein